MKYRVTLEYGLYEPQFREWFIWKNTSYPAVSFHTLDEALEEIESHKKMLSRKGKQVVWESSTIPSEGANINFFKDVERPSAPPVAPPKGR